MATLRALWWWIDRWRKSTAYTDMTLMEQGAYRNLLDEAHLRGGPLPADERILAKACGDPRAWKRVRGKVLAHFYTAPDGLRNATLDSVLARSAELHAARVAAGRRGGLAKASNQPSKLLATEVATELAKSYSPSPSPSPDVRTGVRAALSGSVPPETADSAAPQTAPSQSPSDNPDDNVEVITALVLKEILPLNLPEAELADAVKDRCAYLEIAYTGTVVRKAIESAQYRRHLRTPLFTPPSGVPRRGPRRRA